MEGPALKIPARGNSFSTAYDRLYIATGGVIDFGNGNMLITHAAGQLSFTGGNFHFGGTSLESWDSDYTVIEVGGNGALISTTAAGANGAQYLLQNAYWDGDDWKYQDTDEASLIQQQSGLTIINAAVSGVADANITWLQQARFQSTGLILFTAAAGAVFSGSVGAITNTLGFWYGDVITGPIIKTGYSSNALWTDTTGVMQGGGFFVTASNTSSNTGNYMGVQAGTYIAAAATDNFTAAFRAFHARGLDGNSNANTLTVDDYYGYYYSDLLNLNTITVTTAYAFFAESVNDAGTNYLLYGSGDGLVVVNDPLDATSLSAASVILAGGLAVVKKGRFGDELTIDAAGGGRLILENADATVTSGEQLGSIVARTNDTTPGIVGRMGFYAKEDFSSGNFLTNFRVDLSSTVPGSYATVFEMTGDSELGFFSTTPAIQTTKISDPSGGATVDAEARTAIDAIIDSLESYGLAANV